MSDRSPEAQRRKEALGGGRFGITCTFWNGPVALVVVGKNKADCREQARRSMGEWETEVWSTPVSIYNDLTGVTAERTARKGEHHNAHQDGLW